MWNSRARTLFTRLPNREHFDGWMTEVCEPLHQTLMNARVTVIVIILPG